ncbi:hypothetical protein PM8797T_17062 [Gimesia maris DSM 8797]|nr:hypothetical protein PM8797T_17062 [Gimesia maris DSM 8797]
MQPGLTVETNEIGCDVLATGVYDFPLVASIGGQQIMCFFNSLPTTEVFKFPSVVGVGAVGRVPVLKSEPRFIQG